jgi:hypothetical protein
MVKAEALLEELVAGEEIGPQAARKSALTHTTKRLEIASILQKGRRRQMKYRHMRKPSCRSYNVNRRC